MRKYWQVAKNTWSEIAIYRLNFLMWRIRTVLQFLTVYFLWSILIPNNTSFLGYSHSQILTYLLGTTIVASIVFATRTHEIGDNINSGDLSIFLLKPINYFLYWLARDAADKGFNLFFSIGELVIFAILLRPPLFVQTDFLLIILFFISILLAVVLSFFIGSLLGLIGFWSPEVWAPRFIFFTLLTFFAGALFPLDILPQGIYQIFQLLPFSYLLYFPLKIYLGELTFTQILNGFIVTGVWIILSCFFTLSVWLKGLRMYTALGR